MGVPRPKKRNRPKQARTTAIPARIKIEPRVWEEGEMNMGKENREFSLISIRGMTIKIVDPTRIPNTNDAGLMS